MNRIHRDVVSFLICLASLPPLLAQDTEIAEIRYSMPWQVISPGEPLVVNMEIENLLTEPININLGHGQSSGVQATVTLPTGLTIPVQRVPSDRNKCCGMYFGPVPVVTLEGRQVLKQQILFDGWYRAPIYGKYTVQSNLLNPNVRSASGRLAQLAPGRPVEFTVTPRNVAALRDRWDALQGLIASGSNPEARVDAALVLSQVSDPDVVPYLKWLVSVDETLVRLATAALERIGTPSASDALEELSRSRDPIVGGSATAALTRMGRR